MDDQAAELHLFIDNTEPLYRQKVLVFMALAKKMKRGVFDEKLAPKAFVSLTTRAAKEYMREFGTPADRWNQLFSTTSRREVAEILAKEFVGWYKTDYPWYVEKGRGVR